MDGIEVTLFREGWKSLDKEPDSTIAMFSPPGRWVETKGVRFDLTYVLISGPTREAVADYLQEKRDEYGHRDTTHCVLYGSAGWFELDGHSCLPIVLWMTSEDHVPSKYVELRQAVLEIKDMAPRAEVAQAMVAVMSETVAQDIDREMFESIGKAVEG